MGLRRGLLARVDAKLLHIMPKLQILLDKGNATFNNNKRKRFRVLNFPRAAILDFMTSLRCLYCWKAEVFCLNHWDNAVTS